MSDFNLNLLNQVEDDDFEDDIDSIDDGEYEFISVKFNAHPQDIFSLYMEKAKKAHANDIEDDFEDIDVDETDKKKSSDRLKSNRFKEIDIGNDGFNDDFDDGEAKDVKGTDNFGAENQKEFGLTDQNKVGLSDQVGLRNQTQKVGLRNQNKVGLSDQENFGLADQNGAENEVGLSDQVDFGEKYQKEFEEFQKSDDAIVKEKSEFTYETNHTEEFKETCTEAFKTVENVKLSCSVMGNAALQSLMQKAAKDEKQKQKEEKKRKKEQDSEPVKKNGDVVRKFDETKNKGVMPSTTYAKPKEEGGFISKLIPFVISTLSVGTFFGVQANSYFLFHEGKVTPSDCTFGWLMEENMPISIDPFVSDVFFNAFGIGFGIMAIIGLFIYLDSDAKKQSRVGHEHGNARLGTPRDFKEFKNKFMEM